ncbi:hypothetical protein BJX76DRAFT_347741 [Aspergillus varians]
MIIQAQPALSLYSLLVTNPYPAAEKPRVEGQQKLDAGMVVDNKQCEAIMNYDLSSIDLSTLLFDSPIPSSIESTVLHAEATDPSNATSKAQTRLLTRQIAHILCHHFGVLLPPVFYGVVAAGGVWSAASPNATPHELENQIHQRSSRLIISGPESKDAVLKAAKGAGVPENRVLILRSAGHERVLQNAATRHNYLGSLKSSEVLDWERITDPKKLESSLVCLLYSSGTTGVPKGVIASHLNMAAQYLFPVYYDYEYIVQRRQADLKYEHPYHTLAHLPAAHVAGCQGYFVNAAEAGGTVYWMEKVDFPKSLEYNKKLGITTFFTVPPILLLISLSPAVTNQFKTPRRLSETLGSTTGMPWEIEDLTSSVSRLPNMRLRIVDDDGRDVEEGKEGELLIEGPVLIKGYYRNTQATKEAFTDDGWFKSGDIDVRRDGLFYIVDRKKELIKYKGLQVAPAELEAHLISHPLIFDAAVIGVQTPGGSGNEIPRAYIVADKTKISENQVKDFVKGHLAHYKQLRGGVVDLQAIPKSSSGKILRRELREFAKKRPRRLECRLSGSSTLATVCTE